MTFTLKYELWGLFTTLVFTVPEFISSAGLIVVVADDNVGMANGFSPWSLINPLKWGHRGQRRLRLL